MMDTEEPETEDVTEIKDEEDGIAKPRGLVRGITFDFEWFRSKQSFTLVHMLEKQNWEYLLGTAFRTDVYKEEAL